MSSTFFKKIENFFEAQNRVVGVGVLDDPSQKSDLDGLIFAHTELPPCGGWDVGDAIPYDHQLRAFSIRVSSPVAISTPTATSRLPQTLLTRL